MPARPYWFRAKRYGWGWGLPLTWQGWFVLALFFALVLLGAVVLLPAQGQLAFVAWCTVLCVLLVGVCWIKGEPPAWRWGRK
jgi:hypothetical protein